MVTLFELDFLLNLFPILREFLLTDTQLFLREKDGVSVLFPLLNLVVERGQDERISSVEPTTIFVSGGLVLLFISSLTTIKNLKGSDGPIDVGLDVLLNHFFCKHGIGFFVRHKDIKVFELYSLLNVKTSLTNFGTGSAEDHGRIFVWRKCTINLLNLFAKQIPNGTILDPDFNKILTK